MQLSHIDKIERALALFMVVAWRIAYLMLQGRTCPDLDASHFFDPDEIRGAYLLTKERRPDRPPTLNEVLRLVARVGGFLGRKGDGDPGVKTIWQGIQEVRVAALNATNFLQVPANPTLALHEANNRRKTKKATSANL